MLATQPLMSYRSAARIVLITLLLLSGFVAAKSYVAVHNIEQWSDDIRRFFMIEQAEAGKRAYPIEFYLTRLDNIQKQWTIIRHVSFTSCVICCVGIYFLSLNEKRLVSKICG